MKGRALWLLACLALGCGMAACTAPAPVPASKPATTEATTPASAPSIAVAPVEGATVVQHATQAGSMRGDPLAPSRACKIDADCAVKNVGNCCGAMPACVSATAHVDPAAVKVECQRQGVASTCGFPKVDGCTCQAGQCQATTSAVAR